jgi:hypothetical protein
MIKKNSQRNSINSGNSIGNNRKREKESGLRKEKTGVNNSKSKEERVLNSLTQKENNS